MDSYPTIGYPVSDEELRVAWQTAEERCQLLLKYIPDLVFALDEGGMIIAINEAIARFGYQVDELIGQSLRFLILADDRDILTDVLAEAIARKEPCTGRKEVRIIARGGTTHQLACDYAVRFNPQGDFLFMQGICRTIRSASARLSSAPSVI